MILRVLIAAAAAWTLAGTAHADWFRAETDRFIVYGEGREAKVRDYADKLTKFDAALRVLHPSTRDRPSYTRTQLVLVDSETDLRRVLPHLNRQVAGIYVPRTTGVFAIAVTDASKNGDDTLYHEYAHHFMLENFPTAYPAWFVEGFAEYFMTAQVKADGVHIGDYNPGRAYTIFNMTWLPWSEIFTKRPFQLPAKQRYNYYAQSWLLTHYMQTGGRAAQLDAAVQAIAHGAEPAAAFWKATGWDEQSLTRELRRYRKLPTMQVKASALPPVSVSVTRMPPSADDVLLAYFRLLVADPRQGDAAFVEQVRQRAARYPDDSLAQRTLALAEYYFGDVAAGDVVIAKLRAAHSADNEVLLTAGWGALAAGHRDPKVREARWRAARPLFAQVYAKAKDDFRPIFGYALSRTIEPAFPTDNDMTALLEARALSPAVQEINTYAGLALLAKGRREDAAIVLGPVINDPHGGRAAAHAKARLEGRSSAEADKAAEAAGEEAAAEGEAP
ncbi:hypothetical protein [Phenylobacterium sp.]|uniref:hypothetical protein n=1 Tax=Phenylobacterium sp. TaxID=1871053 RepID=UPI0037834A2D